MNVGVICGCVPHLSPLFRHHHIKVPDFSSLRHLVPGLLRKGPKRSSFSEKRSEETLGRVDFQTPPNGHYLGTQILNSSAQGQGKFLQSGDFERQEWLDRSASSPSGQGQPTYREVWDCRV